MQQTVYSTEFTPPNKQREYWRHVINETYLPLSFEMQNKDRFNGKIESWQLGHLSISNFEADAIRYRRERHHVCEKYSDYYLATIPKVSSMLFCQNGKRVECSPGLFTLQGSTTPYSLQHDDHIATTVVKIPGEMLRARISVPDDYCATRLVCSSSAGALFVDFISSLLQQAQTLPQEHEIALGNQLVNLLVMVLEASEGDTPQADSAAQDAHLRRVYHYINMNLQDPGLSPQQISDHCAVSLRYLHQLFNTTGWTVSKWILERRLQECFNMLTDPNARVITIANLAYQWGFSDPAHFSRCFKTRFSITPGDAKASTQDNAKVEKTRRREGFTRMSYLKPLLTDTQAY